MCVCVCFPVSEAVDERNHGELFCERHSAHTVRMCTRVCVCVCARVCVCMLRDVWGFVCVGCVCVGVCTCMGIYTSFKPIRDTISAKALSNFG